ERRGGQAHDLRVGEQLEDPAQARGDVAVTLVDEDQVEEVVRELRKPAIGRARELLDVCHDEVGLAAISEVRVLAVEDGEVRTVLKITNDSCLGPKGIGGRVVELSGD